MRIIKHIDFEVADFGELTDGLQDKPGYRSVVTADSPVVYWRLGDAGRTIAADEMERCDGSYQNEPALSHTGALYRDSNGAVQLNGINQEIMASQPLFDGQYDAFSIELWLRTHLSDTFILSESPKVAPAVDLVAMINATGHLAVWIGGTEIGVANQLPGVNDSCWHHIVISRDSNGLFRVYIDNQTQLIGTNTGLIRGTVFRLGGLYGVMYFEGMIDEFAIYDCVLSNDQVKQHYQAGTGQ